LQVYDYTNKQPVMKSLKSFGRRLVAYSASPAFFRLIIGLLVAQAAWIAATGRYPMAFDEDFHLGIIKLYAHHLSPFWHGQPAGADSFGAVARDPSYLYQYLMSFPYRLITFFTHSQTVAVLCLRAINVVLLASALPLYRHLLLKTGASRGIVQICLLIFVLLPITPLLAAQINYDNLLLLLVPAMFLLTIDVKQRLQQGALPVRQLAWLLGGCLLTSLIKYAFLPFFLGICIYLGLYGWKAYGRKGTFRAEARTAVRAMSVPLRLSLLVLLIVSAGLFTERYGINLVRYHTPVPSCSQVLNEERCEAYGPSQRDRYYEANKTEDMSLFTSPFTFMGSWVYGMWLRTFFAVDGPSTRFQTRGPLPIPSIAAIVVAVSALGAWVWRGRRVIRAYHGSVLLLFGLATLLYVGGLWADEYKAYLHTGQAVAINGRYLLPIAPFIMLAGALALREALRSHRKAQLVIATLVVVCMCWGGGALTYILRSNDAWYWPGSTVVQDANHAVQHTLGPFTPGYREPTLFLR
jgi:hypothetical protein